MERTIKVLEMIVVFTAIFGASDSLKKAPLGARCVCFTDDRALVGKGWEVVVVYPPPPKPRRAARKFKMTPHEHFADADAWIWVDGSIEIRDLPALLRDVGDAEIACLPHPDRSTCYAEGEAVIRLKIANDVARTQVRAALDSYRAEGFAPAALSTTGLFYRRNTPRVAAFNELWRDELNRYGTNDQIHVDYCAWKSGIEIRHLPGHYRANAYARYDQVDHHRRRKPQFLPESECREYLA